jgi:hypothetical protein
LRSARRAIRQPGHRDDTGIPVPRRAVTSSAVRANGSPQSTQTCRTSPVRASMSSGCNLVSCLFDTIPDLRVGDIAIVIDRHGLRRQINIDIPHPGDFLQFFGDVPHAVLATHAGHLIRLPHESFLSL